MNSEQFRRWYVEPVKKLQPDKSTGFPLLTITLPLLERYVRNRCNLGDNPLCKAFYVELVNLIPELESEDFAWRFWKSIRDGLMHQATLSDKDRKGRQLPKSALTRDIASIVHDKNENQVFLNPVWFSNRVLSIVGTDLETYVGKSDSCTPLPREQLIGDLDSTCAYTESEIFEGWIELEDESKGSNHV